MDKLRALKYFQEVADSGSFAIAARSLGVPSSSISRRIQDLETELGAILIHRTTRVVKLTELGTVYLEHIRPAIVALDYADEIVGNQAQMPCGTIRISSTPGFGRFCLMPALTKLKVLYPDMVFDLEFTDQVSNLASNEVDIAIRSTATLPERVVARKITHNQFILVASPSYLDASGTPVTAADLQKHKTLLFRRPNGVLYWQANIAEIWQELRTPIAFISNEGEGLISETLAGRGIALVPQWGVEAHLADKKLVKIVLSDARISITRHPDSGIYLLYYRPKYGLKKIKTAVDFLLSELTNPSSG